MVVGVLAIGQTLVILTALTALSLLGFVFGGQAVLADTRWLYALLIMPIWGVSSVIAVL